MTAIYDVIRSINKEIDPQKDSELASAFDSNLKNIMSELEQQKSSESKFSEQIAVNSAKH